MKNPIFDIENWREIGTTLAQNKTRTFMTGFGIFWGTAMLALLLGGAEGLKHFMSRNFEGFATNAATIFPERTTKSYAGFNKGMALEMNLQDADNIRRAIPDIENSSSVNFMWANALYGDKKSNAQLTGVENKYDKIFEPIIFDGRFLNEADNANYRKVCVLGKKVASELFGTASGVGNDIQLNGIYYKVIGVVGQISEITIGANMDESIFIPSNSMRRSYNLGDRIDIFMMTFRQGTKPGNYEKQLRRIIASNHPIAPDDDGAFHYFNISEMFEMVDNVFAGITLLALVVGTGTLLSGVIGVGNIMWIIVRERTHEIGIRRAIGAKPRSVLIQIVLESVAITALFGYIGVFLGMLVMQVVDFATKGSPFMKNPTIDISIAIEVTIVLVVAGAFAGLFPALKATKVKPVEALRDE